MNRIPPIEGISSSFAELTAASESLNIVSDELGKAVSDIDAGLKKLNLGITAWVEIYAKSNGLEDPTYYVEELGYGKVNGKWGVALRARGGDESQPQLDERVETWLFNDAARILRLKAIEKFPELLKKLGEEAAKTTKELQAKLACAQAVAAAVNPSVPRLLAVDSALLARGIVRAVEEAPPVNGFMMKRAPTAKGFILRNQQPGAEVEK